MKLLLAIDAPTWAPAKSNPEDQWRRNAFAKLLRDMADRISNGGGGAGRGTQVTFTGNEDFTGTYRLEDTPPAKSSAAA